MNFFAPCPPGAEGILSQELRRLGAESVQSGSRGVCFTGDRRFVYTACLYLRTASRLLVELRRGAASDEDGLYKLTRDFPWHSMFDASASIACRVTGVPRERDPRYATMRLKDAVADSFTALGQARPWVDRKNPDIRIEAHWDGKNATIFLNWSGPPLHERGYRLQQTDASMRETTVASVLALSGWPEIAQKGGAFVDPVCGSGTFLAEAAMMAVGAPPGIHRKKWGFQPWKDHDEEEWLDVRNEALVHFGNGLESMPPIFGYDRDYAALEAAKANLRRAGLGPFIHLKHHDITQGQPTPWPKKPLGLMCADPPYGHRSKEAPPEVYAGIASVFRSLDAGWRLALLAPDRKTAAATFLKAKSYLSTVSGGLDLVLALYDRHVEPRRRPKDHTEAPKASEGALALPQAVKAPSLRKALKRNLAALGPWAEKTAVTSYRIWDADLPEFNAAVDWYEGRWLHVQEFEPPRSIPREKTQRRLDTLLQILKEETGCTDENLFLKTRRRGVRPYHRMGRGERYIMRENNMRFFVNFTDYLDAGIFLDHRSTRVRIQNAAKGRHFLNLFAYTGTATVMAVSGGAAKTVSVDVSNTYLKWAQDNLKLNRFESKKNLFVRSDAMEYLEASKESFDLIFIDPPTYSNGAGRRDWSVQDGHGALIRLAMGHLRPGGLLLFSENFRRFVLDTDLKKEFRVREITQETLPPDFVRRGRAHRCWEFSLF